MTYQAYELSVEDGAPVELYEFRFGLISLYYTSAEADISYGVETYLAEPISRTNIDLSNELNKKNITITVIRSNAVADYFRIYPPDDIVSVTVRRLHRNDTDNDAVALWVGRVLSVIWSDTTAKLYCEPASTSLKRVGLRRHYQAGCPFTLFGKGCYVVRTNYRLEATVLSVSGVDVTLPGASAKEDTYYAGGYVSWVDDNGVANYRTIASHTGDVVTLMVSAYGLESGIDVEVYPGCNHTLSQCDVKYSNEINFGGMPFVPPVNPFNTQVY